MTKSKDLVVKSNNLVEARYRLTIWESRVFAKMVTMINKDDDDFKMYEISIRELMNFFGTKAHNDYERIKEVPEMLLSRTIRIPNTHKGKDVYDVYSFLSKVTIPRGETNLTDNSIIRVRFDPDLKPYLLQLQEKFLKYDIKNLLRISSPHSVRIYELLKQFENTGWRQITIEEFKEILGVEDKYNRYYNFKKRVILQAQKDLGMYTDICFTFDEIKRGRTVIAIKFIIYTNSPSRKKQKKKTPGKKKPTTKQEQTPKPQEIPGFEIAPEIVDSEAVQMMVKEGISYDQSEKLFTQFGNESELMDEVRSAKKKANQKKGLQNRAGFMLKLIRERDYQKTSKFKKAKKEAKAKEAQEKQKEQETQERRIQQLRTEYESKRNIAVKEYLKDLPKKEIDNTLSKLIEEKANRFQKKWLERCEQEGKKEEAQEMKYQLFAMQLDESLHTFDKYLDNVYKCKVSDNGQGKFLVTIN